MNWSKSSFILPRITQKAPPMKAGMNAPKSRSVVPQGHACKGVVRGLLIILLLALILRFVGINYGLPYFFVGDEQSQLGASLVMMKDFNLIPATAPADFKLLYYPPVMSYFYLLVLVPVLAVWMILRGFGPGELARKVALDPTLPWIAGRLLVVFLGVLSVYLVYLLGKRIRDERAGLFAAFFLATSFLHVSLSHFTKHWVPTIFFEILAMLAAWNIWKFGRRKDYFWAAVFVALSFGVGFIGILAGFFPVVAHFARRGVEGIRDKNFWFFVGLLVILVLIIVLLFPQRFSEISAGTDISVTAQKSWGGFWESLVFHIRTLALADPVLLVLSVVGIFLGLRLSRGPSLIFLFFSFLYMGSLYFVIHNESRYITFLYPGLAVLAALPAGLFVTKLKSALFARVVSAILLLGFIGYPLAVSGKFAYLLSQDDTRIQAKKWIEANIPQDRKILSFIKPEVLTPTKEALKLQEEVNPESLRTQDKILLKLSPEKYPSSYYLVNWYKIGNTKTGEFIPDYAILQYWNFEEFIKISSLGLKLDLHPIRFTSALSPNTSVDFTGNFEGPSFLVFKTQRLGPILEIHKL